MQKQEFVNFKEISAKIPFIALLNHLNQSYTETEKELKGENSKFCFIIDRDKNLFLCPHNKDTKGSVINYYSELTGLDLRSAAIQLKKTFLKEEKPPQKDIPILSLEYTEDVGKLGITAKMAEDFEIGKVKGKSVLSGCIAFRVYYEDGEPAGYVGYKNDEWIFPKGSKRGNIVYNLNRAKTPYAILVPDIFDCLHLIEAGYPFTVALMSNSATDEQINLLTLYFKRILVIHSKPENLVSRISPHSFVKAIKVDKILNLTSEDVTKFF